jgi:hypothetical protein
MNRAFTSTGPNGVANDATRLTATTNNGYIVDAAPVVGTGKITSVWIKRITGTGAVYLANGGGSTWEAVTVTTSWTRVSSKIDGGADTGQGIKLATSGDAVDVWGFTQWTATFAYPSTLVTQAVAASVSADVLTYPIAGNLDATVGSASARINIPASVGVSTGPMISLSTAGQRYIFYGATSSRVGMHDGVNTCVGGNNTFYGDGITRAYSGSWSLGDGQRLYLNGALVGTKAFDGSYDPTANMGIGYDVRSPFTPIQGSMAFISVFSCVVPAPDLARLR